MVNPKHAMGDLASSEYILRHGQVAEQIKLLEDDPDALPQCVGGVLELHRDAIDENSPGRRLLDPGDDLHHGRFTSSVFPHQDVHGTAPDLEVRVP